MTLINIKEEGEAVLMLGLKEEESTGDGRYVYTHILLSWYTFFLALHLAVFHLFLAIF